MKIYLASSWKNEVDVRRLAIRLRNEGCEVDCLCEPKEGRFVFSWRELVENHKELLNHNAKDFLDHPKVLRAYQEDIKYLDWADCLILLLPCGNSAHMEAGYIKGAGKLLYILGGFESGKFDVMYGMANKLFWLASQMHDLIEELHIRDK